MSHEPGIFRPQLSPDGHFTIVRNDWIRNSGLNPNANYLLIYLVSHEVGYEIKFDQISRETKLGVRAIRTAMQELKDAGWLKAQRSHKPNGQLGPYRYEITEPTTVRLSTVADSTVADSTVAHRTDIKKTNNKENKSLENKVKEQAQSHLLFQEFWKEYPRKLDKGKAERAFKSALTRSTFEDILAGVIQYADDPNRNPDFTKYPATWLNADSWENGPLPYDKRAHSQNNEQENKRKLDEYIRQQTEMGN